jgi:hypothetical protein
VRKGQEEYKNTEKKSHFKAKKAWKWDFVIYINNIYSKLLGKTDDFFMVHLNTGEPPFFQVSGCVNRIEGFEMIRSSDI